MSYVLTQELDQIVQEKLGSGQFANEEEVLRMALQLLDEQEATVAAVAEGYEDIRAGRHRPFDEADAEFRCRNNISDDV